MIDTRNAPYGFFLLRVALGVMFIAHAWLKYARLHDARLRRLPWPGRPARRRSPGRSSWPSSSAASRSCLASTAAGLRPRSCRSCSARCTSMSAMAGCSRNEWRLGVPRLPRRRALVTRVWPATAPSPPPRLAAAARPRRAAGRLNLTSPGDAAPRAGVFSRGDGGPSPAVDASIACTAPIARSVNLLSRQITSGAVTSAPVPSSGAQR